MRRLYGNYESHPAAEAFPLIDESELAELAADIKAHGLKNKIVTWGNYIVDGRHRWLALESLGIDPSEHTVEGHFENDIDVWETVFSDNFFRRHLTTSQRAIAAGLYSVAISKTQNFTPTQAIDMAADTFAISSKTVKNARAVIDKGSEALRDAVNAGEVTVSAAADLARTLPKSRQDVVVKRGGKAVAAKARKARESGGTKAPTPAEKPVGPYDKNAEPVPERLAPLFVEARATVKDIKQHIGEVRDLLHGDQVLGAPYITRHLDEFWASLVSACPSVLCERCKGNDIDCTWCDGRGWFNEGSRRDQRRSSKILGDAGDE